MAATLASAIGQLSKPLTSAAANGKGIDWRDAIRSGGMPSTHAAVRSFVKFSNLGTGRLVLVLYQSDRILEWSSFWLCLTTELVWIGTRHVHKWRRRALVFH